MPIEIEQIINGLVLAEGPHWDNEAQALFFVDVVGNQKLIGKYEYSTKKYTKVSVEPHGCSFVIPLADQPNQFIVAFKEELTIIEWDGVSDHYEIVEKLHKVPYCFNDAKIDPLGRLWTGTHNLNLENFDESPADGELYCFDTKCEMRKSVDKLKLSNGLTFNLKTKQFYHIDSLKYCIDQYDYDNESGTISNGRVLFSLKKHDIVGMPDGMTIDADGNLWVAVIHGGCVLKIDGEKPETLLDTIQMPTPQVTSVAFGGPDLDELFVTTGSITIPNFPQPEPDAGGVYRVTGLGVKGLPMNKYRRE